MSLFARSGTYSMDTVGGVCGLLSRASLFVLVANKDFFLPTARSTSWFTPLRVAMRRALSWVFM